MCSRTQLSARPTISSWPGTGNNTLLVCHGHSREQPQLLRPHGELAQLLRRSLALRGQVRNLSHEPIKRDPIGRFLGRVLQFGMCTVSVLIVAAIFVSLFIDILMSLIELLQPP